MLQQGEFFVAQSEYVLTINIFTFQVLIVIRSKLSKRTIFFKNMKITPPELNKFYFN